MAVGVSIALAHRRSHNNLSAVEIPNGPPHRLLHVSFNQDGGCFAAGTTAGFRIYNCEPFREITRRDLVDNAAGGRGGIKAVEMLFRTNLLALVAGNETSQAVNEVAMWDDHQRRFVGSLTAGRGGSPARGVRVLRECVAVVTDSAVTVHDFSDLRPLHRFETPPNPRGLCAVTPVSPGSRALIACPGPREGQVRVEHLELGEGRSETVLVDAHTGAPGVACLALSLDGRMVATAAAGSAAVRAFDAGDGRMLQEASLAGASEVHSLAFSGDGRFLAASGDGGAVQVFGLPEEGGASHAGTSRFRTGDGERCIVAFGAQGNTVVMVGIGGSFCRCRFDPVHGGEMVLLERRAFM